MRTSLPLALASLALACAGGPPDRPASYSGPPHISRIYAVDAFAASRLLDVLIYSADGHAVSPPPPSFTRFRVEFDQPIDPTLVEATAQNNLLTPANATAGSSSYAFCSPPAGTQPIKLFDASTGTDRAVEVSACYNPTSQLGQAPAIVIIPAAGQIAAAGATAFTCQSFAPEVGGAKAKPDSNYALVIDPNSIANASDSTKKLELPTGGGWSGSRFTYKTAKFDIMAAGHQNSVTGYFDWIDKPFAGFMPDISATPASAEIDCDPAASISQTGCKVFSDGSPFLIVTTNTIDTATLTPANVSITRADGSTFDSFVDVARQGRAIVAGSNGTFEPGQDYKVTLNLAGIKDTAATPNALGTGQKVYTFTAGPGFNGPGHFAEILAVTPSGGSTNQDPTIGSINAFFQFPVDPTTAQSPANWIVKINGTTVTGTPVIDAGTNNQSVTWTPDVAPTPQFGATVTARVQNVKVGPGTKHSSDTFPAMDWSFATSRFHIDDIFSGTTAIGGRKNAPPDVLNSGLIVQFDDDVDTSTVSAASLVLKDSAGTTIPTTRTFPAPNQVGLKATTAVTAKFNATYSITATSAIKSIHGVALNEETCATTGCADTRNITTQSLSVGAPTNPRIGTPVGAFTVAFNLPVDPTTVTSQLANIKLLELARLPDNRAGTPNGTSIPISCTLGADNKTITCTPSGTPKVNTYYQVLVPFTNVKPATTFGTTPVDPAYTFTGVVTRTFLTGC